MQNLLPAFFIVLIVLMSCKDKSENTMKGERYILVDKGIHLFVETYGQQSNEACILISGAGANSSFWSEHLCDSLVQNGFFVIKYDHRDFGYSTKIDWNKHPYDFDQLVNDPLVILDSIAIEKAHFIGHSMGGFIVQLMAIHYPERVLSMTSISSSTNSPAIPLPPAKTWEIYLSLHPQNNMDIDLPGFLRIWKYLNGTADFDEELAVRYTQNLYKRQPINGALGASHVKAQATLHDRSEELKNVLIPTLVMHGEEDYAVDKYGGIQTASLIENSELILIPQMGHIPFNFEILKRFENEIIRFIIKNKNEAQNK